MQILLGLLLALLAGSFSVPTPSVLAQTAPATINVTAPVGSACYKGGGQLPIAWTMDSNVNHAYISYFGGNSNNPVYPTNTNISGGHPTNGPSLNWTTPAITASDIKIYAEAHTANHSRIGSGTFSGIFSIDSSGPSAPTLSTRCAFPTCGGIAPTTEIMWSVSTDTGCKGLTGYEVFRDNKHIAYTQTNSFTDTNVVAGKTYRYKISAYDDFGFADSNILSVTTGAAPQTPPPAPTQPTLKIAKTGNGSGEVTATGIDCGTDCEQQYPNGTMVTLNAVGDFTSKFVGWSGDCLAIGTHTCQTTVDASKTVAANFTKVKIYTLTLSKTGTGDGMVSSSVMPGIKCGDVCSLSYKEGSVVFLNAAEDATSEFKGWTGDCLGIGSHTCKTTMNNNVTVTANFEKVQMYTLTIKNAGDGSGVVTKDGVECRTECKETVKKDTEFTLKGTADSGSELENFSGDCLGIGAGICRVTMDGDKTITFSFKNNTQGSYKTLGIIIAVAGLAYALWRKYGKHTGVTK